MSTLTRIVARAVPVLGGAARVGAGALWIFEGTLKYRAGFGAADIALVAQSTAGNSRTPWWFAPLGSAMEAASGLFGVVIPALEVLLGVLLILGVGTKLVAVASIGTLMLYWGSDQLAPEYPIIVVFSVVVLALPKPGLWGIDGLLARRRARVAGRQ